MTQIDDNIKYGMIEAISHLIHRDYDAIVEDFVTLDFIPPGTDLQPILPVLAKVFDQALEGGGAKSINFQDLAADLAQITFDYPFRIPPYFALIIRAIGVLEGIALVGDPNFAIVDEAFPYISKRLITDDSPRLRESLRYMVYGRNGVFDAERLIDLLYAFEAFSEASQSARGQMDLIPNPDVRVAISQENRTQLQFPSINTPELAASPLALGLSLMTGPMMALSPAAGFYDEVENGTKVREALKFFLSPQGAFFRDFLLDEAVKSVDALSRSQFRALLAALGMQEVSIPILLPGIAPRLMKVAPPLDENDEIAVKNITKIVGFFAGDSKSGLLIDLIGPSGREVLPYLPSIASEVLPRFSRKLMGRIAARMLREAFI
jgi:aarF domain-containing kinase